MKVDLIQDRERHPQPEHRTWKKSLPFHVNPRGILIHRVRSVTTMWVNSLRRWDVIGYYCGNAVCGSGRDLTDNPPASRLLCERCELAAELANQKSADELVGRHVHVGRVRPFRTCCKELEQ